MVVSWIGQLLQFIYIYSVVQLFKVINYCLALPYLPGGAELAKKFVQENGHTKEHEEFYGIVNMFGFKMLLLMLSLFTVANSSLLSILIDIAKGNML